MAVADNTVNAALQALRSATSSENEVTLLEGLVEEEKIIKARRREVAKNIKKAKRKDRNLAKRLNKLETTDVLDFLKRRLRAANEQWSSFWIFGRTYVQFRACEEIL